MKRRLLVTGSNGFTGKHIIDLAKKYGYECIELKSNITDKEQLELEINKIRPTHVIHLAAISSVTHSDQLELYKINVFGTLNLLDAITTLPQFPEKIILASSANVYGNCSNNFIDEEIPHNPLNHYANSKLVMENMAKTYLNQLNVVITRPFNYTGVGHDDRFVIPKLVNHFKAKNQEIELGNLDVFREYNDVRMISEIYLKLLDHGVVGNTYNICTGKTYSLNEVITLLEKITNHKIKVKKNPSLIRDNEVIKLSGNPSKLYSNIGEPPSFKLEETLNWMLSTPVNH